MKDRYYGEDGAHGGRDGGSKPPSPERAAAWVICIAATAAGVWLLFAYAWGAILPFLLAYLLALGVRPLVRRAVGNSRLPRGLVAAVLVILLVGGVVLAVAWGCGRAARELEGLVTRLGSGESGFGATLAEVQDWVHSLSSHLPFLERFENTPGFEAFCLRLDALVRDAADRALAEMGQWASDTVMGMVSRLPSAFLFLVILLLSCYYFSADDGRIGRAVTALLPTRAREKWPAWRSRGREVMRKYVRAYVILGLITFVEMFVGLSAIGLPYAFLMAGIIALVDFLPLLGTGVILVPWAVLQFIVGETGQGIGLLLLWAIASLLRQMVEPKLVSAGLGIHPLLSLAAMYMGLQFFGIVGMILCPLAVTAVKAVWSGGTEVDRPSTTGKHGEDM